LSPIAIGATLWQGICGVHLSISLLPKVPKKAKRLKLLAGMANERTYDLAVVYLQNIHNIGRKMIPDSHYFQYVWLCYVHMLHCSSEYVRWLAPKA